MLNGPQINRLRELLETASHLGPKVKLGAIEFGVAAVTGAVTESYLQQDATPLTYLRGALEGVGTLAAAKFLTGNTDESKASARSAIGSRP